MALGVHPPMTPIGELSLVEGEEAEMVGLFDSEIPEGKGKMKIGGKSYQLFPKSPTEKTYRFCLYIHHTGTKNHRLSPDTSPMHLATTIYGKEAKKTPSPSSHRKTSPPVSPSFHPGKSSMPLSPRKSFEKSEPQKERPTDTKRPTLQTHRQEVRCSERSIAKPRGKEQRESRESRPSLQARQWTQEETVHWWQQRYHQKEREEGRQGGDQREESNQEQPKKKKKRALEGIAATSTAKSPPSLEQQRSEKGGVKPLLKPPKVGLFALYYILTKIGILSDGSSNFSYKKEIEGIDNETTTAHKQRLEKIKAAIEKEQSAARWEIANKVFSWIGSLTAIITGAVLIATGVGAVTGAILIAGGLIQLTNQILEMTNGWQKIAEKLPGDNLKHKRAVIAWMQIGIAVLCLILSSVGVIWGGFSQFNEAMQIAKSAYNAMAVMGQGMTSIGEGIYQFMLNDKMSEVKQYDKILAELKHKRCDLMERMEWGINRLEKLFEGLARALEFEIELFRADQMVNR